MLCLSNCTPYENMYVLRLYCLTVSSADSHAQADLPLRAADYYLSRQVIMFSFLFFSFFPGDCSIFPFSVLYGVLNY